MKNTALASSPRAILQTAMDRVYPNRWRLLVVLAVIMLTALESEIAVSALQDAFLAVTVFVAATFALVFACEKLFVFDLGVLMARHKIWQPALASLLGIMPGCGGAILVVTQFTRGYAGFGALIAVLVSTMGDAAFLLLAREPVTALSVFAIAGIAGTITGMIVDGIHGAEFLAQERDARPPRDMVMSSHRHTMRLNSAQKLWVAMVGIGIVFGIAGAFLVDAESWFGALAPYEPVKWFGFAAAMLCLLLWATVQNGHSLFGADTMPGDPMGLRIIFDTNFVTSWVVIAFLSYEFLTHFGLDIGDLFGNALALAPLIAILIGFIPGCGPQIVITALYLSGAIPFSALIANAIANDGDALFPALALAPRAAILATLYSAIPALLIGYGFYFYGW